MGITGTDVSKNASDMVLTDDNFATIVKAVEQGRTIFTNISKAIKFLLSSNLGEIISIFIATLLGWHIFLPVHILWINLVTDTFPALALGMEPAEPDIMNRPPRDSRQPFFTKKTYAQAPYNRHGKRPDSAWRIYCRLKSIQQPRKQPLPWLL